MSLVTCDMSDVACQVSGVSQGLLSKHLCYSLIHQLINLVIVKLKYLYGAVTPKRLKMVLPVIKQTLEGHLNRCVGSKVTAILLNGRILPPGGVASGRVCPAACAAGFFKDKKNTVCHSLSQMDITKCCALFWPYFCVYL